MRYYSFSHYPTEEELKELTKQHLLHYHDHCRIWYRDGRKESYVNDTPGIYYYGYEKIWRVYFYSSELERLPIRFLGRDVARHKRIVEKRLDKFL